MPTLHIGPTTFGTVAHSYERGGGSYPVGDALDQLFEAWRKRTLPVEFNAGLIADAMDETEGIDKDWRWEALRNWMRARFNKVIGPNTWNAAYCAHKP